MVNICRVTRGEVSDGVHHVEIRLDKHFARLIGGDHCGRAIERDIARHHFYFYPSLQTITETTHDLPSLFAVLRHVGIATRQAAQLLRRHSPQPIRSWLHHATDLALALGDDVDRRMPIERLRHGPAQLGIVEEREFAIDDQVVVDAATWPKAHFRDPRPIVHDGRGVLVIA